MQQEHLDKNIDIYIENHLEEIIADIGRLVEINSVETPGTPGAPFGAGVARALEAALEMARRMGLETTSMDGYFGWAQLPGETPGVLATIAHLDVVPPGEGWEPTPTGESSAFTLRRREDFLLGRGVLDNKGPAVLCLWAARFLKERAAAQGRPFRYTLRVLLGTDEESGMSDVALYLKDQGEPLFCFTPDADFPLCNGEKGIYEGQFVSAPLGEGNLVEFQAGVASNVVPETAFCLLREVSQEIAECPPGVLLTRNDPSGFVRLQAHGRGGHAARPEETLNAIGLLVEFLLANHLCSAYETPFLSLLQKLFSATDGSGLGIQCQDDAFTPLTCIGGTIRMEENRLIQNINIRFPRAITSAALTRALEDQAAQSGADFETVSIMEPHYISPSSPPIQALLSTYAQVSGRPAQPYTSGGGTYARHFKNAVSFGARDKAFPFPAFAANVHAANEGFSIENLRMALKVYILALLRLMELDY